MRSLERLSGQGRGFRSDLTFLLVMDRFLFLVFRFFWNIAGLVHSISCICGTHKTLHISSSHKTLQNLLHSDKEEETDSHFLHRKTPEEPLCRPYTGHTTDQMTKYLLCLDGALFDINRTTNLLNKNQQAKSFLLSEHRDVISGQFSFFLSLCWSLGNKKF